MRKSKALKTILFAASAGLLVALPNAVAYADTMSVEQGVAGIAKCLEQVDEETAEIITQIYNTEILSPLANKGVSKAESYVNIRKKPNTESEVVGKLYQGCAADILEWLEGDWVKIRSGVVEGYIASNYLATGKDAEIMADKFATKYATVVNTQTLRVREEPSVSEDTKTLELIPLGETYIVIKEYDEWAEILLGADAKGNDFTGFVHKDYVSIVIDFKEAISVEEENRILREQQEAERAEAERKQEQQEEEARRKAEKEAERKAAQAAKDNKKDNKKDEPVSKPSKQQSGDLSSLRSDIITYAKKFVGYSYRWGGESLTGGADCSGFVWRIYKDFGYGLDRTSYQQARTAGKRVDISERKPGDLIFYANNSGTVNHVAMYIGNDKIVHAANSRQGIIISKYNYRNIVRIRRIVY
ncbi:MAG TPA: NlpC/P60 family protein [Mobilitalea sp.]|nr:NlpC/P60 family protein [Mobilitalea sp.]